MSSAFDLNLSLETVLADTGARLVRGGQVSLTGISTDTRRLAMGGLFIGLRGDRFDGSTYGAQALQQGAAAALVASDAVDAALAASAGAVLAVDDTTRALALLARGHRQRMPATLVAITGSNGKTTTKEMLAAVLAQQGPTLATEGNLNNEVGAPLTLLSLRSHHRFGVIEIGMNHEGEIGRLTALVRPRVGVVTCVAPVHIEGCGSLEGVARAKGELFTGLDLDGVAVSNADDALLAERTRWAGRRTVWFGRSQQADVRLTNIISHDIRGLRVAVSAWGRPVELSLPVVGVHNAYNACAAFAAAGVLGIPDDMILRGLATARPPGRRLRLSPIPGADAALLDDCYNANPSSVLAALETMSRLAPEGHRIAVLGDLRELGPDEAQAHAEVGVAAAGAGLKGLVAFGPLSRHTAEAAVGAGMQVGRVLHTEDPAVAAQAVRGWLGTGDVVLVKASRGTRLERVSDLLVPPADAAGGH